MPDLVKQLLLQFTLIALNAFFAATEIAVISLNDKKIRASADDGDKKAAKMLKIINDPTKFLSTIQVGITLAGFLASAFAADSFAEMLSAYLVRTFEIAPSYIEMIETVSVIAISDRSYVSVSSERLTTENVISYTPSFSLSSPSSSFVRSMPSTVR